MKFAFPGVLAEQTVGGQVSWMCSWIGESLSLLTYLMLKTDTVLLESMTLHATTWLSNEILVQLYPSESYLGVHIDSTCMNFEMVFTAFPASLFGAAKRQRHPHCLHRWRTLSKRTIHNWSSMTGGPSYIASCLGYAGMRGLLTRHFVWRDLYIRKCVDIIINHTFCRNISIQQWCECIQHYCNHFIWNPNPLGVPYSQVDHFATSRKSTGIYNVDHVTGWSQK